MTEFGGRYGLIDGTLARHGLRRENAWRLPCFSTAALIVTQSDVLLTRPALTAQPFARIADLHGLNAPVGTTEFRYRQV
ncbi:MAG: hypothetical protein QNJ94_00045 [Alphaproteobacteria bacterium]|nr:hypothetical protein [Alphaproteobacteria bacterium]